MCTFLTATKAVKAKDSRLRLAIVVNRNSPVRNLNFVDLRRLFQGLTRVDSSGHTHTPVNLSGDRRARRVFDREVMNASTTQVKRYWTKQQSKSDPFVPACTYDVERYVRSVPNAIGYMPVDSVPPTLRIVSVNNAYPGQMHYIIVENPLTRAEERAKRIANRPQ